jgi:hypothetical protein
MLRILVLLAYLLVAACVLTLLLAACVGEPRLPAVHPSPTPTERVIEECMCPCAAKVEVDAWLDKDKDGAHGPEEKPLSGVRFRAEWHTYACETGGVSQKRVVSLISDSTGHAQTTITGCACEEFEVYAETPSGYLLTTPDRCRGGCSFGIAPRSGETGTD